MELTNVPPELRASAPTPQPSEAPTPAVAVEKKQDWVSVCVFVGVCVPVSVCVARRAKDKQFFLLEFSLLFG